MPMRTIRLIFRHRFHDRQQSYLTDIHLPPPPPTYRRIVFALFGFCRFVHMIDRSIGRCAVLRSLARFIHARHSGLDKANADLAFVKIIVAAVSLIRCDVDAGATGRVLWRRRSAAPSDVIQLYRRFHPRHVFRLSVSSCCRHRFVAFMKGLQLSKCDFLQGQFNSTQ